MHLQLTWSRRCIAPRVLTHLSPALNTSVFTGDPVDPDKQTSVFEYQQRVSAARGGSCARVLEGVATAPEVNEAWRFRQKALKDFTILSKQQLTHATCELHRCISVAASRTVTWPEGGLCYRGDKVTRLSCFLSTSLRDGVRSKLYYCWLTAAAAPPSQVRCVC